MIQVRVSRLVIVDGHDHQFVQLKEANAPGKPRELTMVIGQTEAAAISYCLEGVKLPRPLTFELAYRLMGELGGHLHEAVIHDLTPQGTYLADLHIEHQGTTRSVDCRPSDAIALSLRASTPIFVEEKVFAAAGGGS